DDQHDQREHDVHCPLDEPADFERGFVDQVNDRQAVDVGDPAVDDVELEEVGYEEYVGGIHGKLVHQIFGMRHGRERKGNVYVIDWFTGLLKPVHDGADLV